MGLEKKNKSHFLPSEVTWQATPFHPLHGVKAHARENWDNWYIPT